MLYDYNFWFFIFSSVLFFFFFFFFSSRRRHTRCSRDWSSDVCSSDLHSIHPVGYMNLLADGAHNFIDGAIIGASYVVSLHVGIATTMAVIFHEIPHELGNFFVLLYAGFTKRRALFFNFVSAVFAIVGTIISLLVGSRVENFSSVMLPLAAGGFIYIAGSDLVPELNKESKLGKSVVQMLAIGLGVGLMLLLDMLED